MVLIIGLQYDPQGLKKKIQGFSAHFSPFLSSARLAFSYRISFSHDLFLPLQQHTWYAAKYWMCEFMCLTNVLLQIYWMNRFFDGEFITYGLRVLTMSTEHQDDRVDPMVFIFPRMTKCTFHKYGPSGSMQKHDSLCVLPLNIVNEKTYIFIWFWYLLLLFALVLMAGHRYVGGKTISTLWCTVHHNRLFYPKHKIRNWNPLIYRSFRPYAHYTLNKKIKKIFY